MPAFAGLGAPDWDGSARGTLIDLKSEFFTYEIDAKALAQLRGIQR